MLYICIFSNKLDLNLAKRVSHTGAQRFFRNPAPYAMYLTQIQEKVWKSKTFKTDKPRYQILFQQMEGYYSEKVKHKQQRQWQVTSIKTYASTARGSIISKMNAVPGCKTTNPAQTAEEENTGRKDTLTKQCRRQLHRSQHWQVMSHLWEAAGQCCHNWYSTYAWPRWPPATSCTKSSRQEKQFDRESTSQLEIKPRHGYSTLEPPSPAWTADPLTQHLEHKNQRKSPMLRVA
jgi:hypothetical protein